MALNIVVLGAFPLSLLDFRGHLLRRLVESGHRVTACASGADKHICHELAGMGVAYRDIPIQRTGMNPVHDLRTLASLVRLFRDLQPDVVLGYAVKPVIWGGLAARVAGAPRFYAMITGLGYAYMDGGGARQRVVRWLVSGLYRVALRRAECVFFQNPDDEAEFRQRGLIAAAARSARIHGSGVDLAHFAPRPLPSQPVFLLLARLIADKGIREYREAARALKKEYPRARFLLGGSLDSNPSAIGEQKLSEWVRSGEIEYLGCLNDVRPSIGMCSVYVLPSYREGTPRTVLEAMAMGRPIITTDAPGCRETVDHGVNGYLVTPKSVDSLAEAMRRFMENPGFAETMGRESLRIARVRYDVHQVNTEIIRAMGV